MALTAMDKLLLWLGIGAAQKGAGRKRSSLVGIGLFRSSSVVCLPY
jgi:hypothetical protein